MSARDIAAAGISLGVHLGVAVLVWAIGGGRTETPGRREATEGRATRVALVRRSAAQTEAEATPEPVVPRRRGPARRAPSPEPRAPSPEPRAPSAELRDPSGELGDPRPETRDPRPEDASAGDRAAGAEARGLRSEDGTAAGAAADEAGADESAPLQAAALEPGPGRGVQGAAAPKPPLARDLAPLVARLQAAAARCYPEAARRFRQSGVATLEFCLDAGGALVRSKVTASSGVAALDDAARGCVLEGALPAGPAIGAGCFTLPVRFGGER